MALARQPSPGGVSPLQFALLIASLWGLTVGMWVWAEQPPAVSICTGNRA